MSGPRRVEVMVLGDSRSAQRAFDQLSRSAGRGETQLQRTSRQMQDAGRTINRAVNRYLVPAVAGTVFAFGQHDQALTRSTAIMGDVDQAMRQKMGQTSKEVAADLNISASDAADAYFFLASAGMSAVQSVEALPQVARFAKAGMFDLARATDLSTDAQSALGLAADDAQENLNNLTRVTDVLVKANTLANASVEEFSTALTNRAGAALRSVGKDIEEGVAVLAAFADQGTKGQRAGEALNIVLRDLQTAALGNVQAFRDANIAVFDGQGNMRNLADVIGDLETHLDGMSDAQRRAALSTLGFQDRSISNLITLMGTSDAIRTYEQELRNAAGTTEQVADRQMEAFNEQLGQVRQQLTNAAIDIGQSFAPMVLNGARAIASLAEGINQLPEPLRNTLVGLTMATAAAGPLLIVGGRLVGMFGQLQTRIAAAGGAKVALNRALGLGVVGAANLISAINPLTIGIAAVAAGTLIYKRRLDEARDSHDRVSQAAETLAESLGLAYGEIRAATDEAGEGVEQTAEQFAAANSTIIRQLRDLDQEAARARLLQIAIDLVHRGNTPEEALAAIHRLAAEAGVPIQFTVDILGDPEAQLDSIRIEAARLVSDVERNLLVLGGANAEAARSLGELAAGFLAVGDQQQFLLALSTINEEFARGDLNGQQYSRALKELHGGLEDVSGVEFSKFRDAGDMLQATLGALTHEGSGATDEMRRVAAAAIELAAANDGQLTPALIEQAQRMAETARLRERQTQLIADGIDPAMAAAAAERELAGGIEDVGDAADGAEGPVDSLDDAIEELIADLEAGNITIEEAERRARELGLEFDDLGVSVDDATHALRRHADELRAQQEPMFALHRAIGDLEDAQAAYDAVLEDSESTQRDVEEAALDLALAAMGLQGAVGDASDVFDGQLDPAFRRSLELAGLTEDQIDKIEKSFRDAAAAGRAYEDDYNARVRADGLDQVLSGLRNLGDVAGRISGTNIRVTGGGPAQAFHQGGIVDRESGPRLRGWPTGDRMIRAKVGEEVLTEDDPRHRRNLRSHHTGGVVGRPGAGGVMPAASDRALLRELQALRHELADIARQPRELTIVAPSGDAADIADETMWALRTGTAGGA